MIAIGDWIAAHPIIPITAMLLLSYLTGWLVGSRGNHVR